MRKLTLIVFALMLLSCARGGVNKPALDTAATRDFPSVKAPAMYSDHDQALDYLTLHFWDNFADSTSLWLCDSTHIEGVDKVKLEEQVGMYSTLLSMISLDKARKYIRLFCGQMESCQLKDSSSNIFGETVKLVAKYLYDPNSPVRNEDIYGALAECLSKSPCIDAQLHDSYAYEARTCALNMVGTKAADFKYTDRYGQSRSLYSDSTPYTLLFFSNPGCPSCAEIIDSLKSNEKIENMVKGEILRIVSIYIDDDIQAWKNHTGDYPAAWMVGYNKDLSIRTDLTYNVRAIPSLYVLNEDKIVLIKDGTSEKVLSYLENIEE